jgi:oligosaccharide repeat unit polymerase
MILLSSACILFVFLALFLLPPRTMSRLSFFSPVFVIFLIYFHGIFLRIIFSSYNDITAFHFGIFSMLLFLIFFCFGYILASSRYLSISGWPRHIPGMRGCLIIFSFSCFILFFRDIESFGARFIVGDNGDRKSNFILLTGADIFIGIFLLQLAYSLNAQRSLRFRYYLIFVLAVSMYSAISARFSIILFVAMFSFVYMYYRSNFRIYVIGVASFLSIFVGLGVLRSYRQGITEPSAEGLIFEQLVHLPYLLDANKTGYIVEHFHLNGEYWYGTTFIHFLLTKIGLGYFEGSPRSFIAKNVFGRTNDSGIPPGVVGELFMNFSWFGILVGGVLIGFLSKIFFNTIKKSDRPFTVVVYAVFLQAFLLFLTVDFQSALFAAIKVLIPIFILDGFYRKYFSIQN